jgi:site-specific DNA-methyltransferase (adenine-specific)
MIRTKAMIKARPITQKDKWETPKLIYRPLNKEFGFTLDPCCETHTAKCSKYYTLEEDGLSKDWQGEIVFCNPPYSNGNIDLWMEKCYKESLKPNTIVVALVAVSTSARWWHQWIMNKAELRFIERRVKFVGAPYTATFSSVIVIFGRSGIKSFKQN